MKYFIIIASIVLFFTSDLCSQTKISANVGYGDYLSNSENSLYIMKDDKYRTYIFYGLTAQNENIRGYNLELEYSYRQINKENIIRYAITNGPYPVVYIYGDMIFLSHTFDLDIKGKLNKYFSYGIGPSFEIINRTFKMNFLQPGISLNDRLASSALGVNAFIDFAYPLLWDGENYLFISSKIKFRYTHSIWFDKGNRDLENYSQEFITGQIYAGLGYAF